WLLPAAGEGYSHLLAAAAIASMSIGNLGALNQPDLRRLLAYSGIAQSGFMLMGVYAAADTGTAATLFYLTLYVPMNLCLFILADLFTRSSGQQEVTGLTGLGQLFPWHTALFTLICVALAGLPPTAGFIAKWNLFVVVLQHSGGDWPSEPLILAIVAALNTALSFYYYLKLPGLMVFRSPAAGLAATPADWRITGLLALLAVPVLLLGIIGFDRLMQYFLQHV
ncbi:MAG: NADH-quinone oxidoreductase subunit N, partial [Bacteroidetes bacterium]